MEKQLIFPMEEKYEEYLTDESRLMGNAQSISFPVTEAEVIKVVMLLRDSDMGITIQSGKTGIVGGAVPMGGHVMNVSGLCECLNATEQPDGSALLTVGTGLPLMELNTEIGRQFRSRRLFWPPQPTETSATVGGILACAAQGINAYHYGNTRKYIEKIRMVLSDGSAIEIARGANVIQVNHEKIDELDLILGGEGLYGVITRATLRLLPKPEEIWGIGFFFESDEGAGQFADKLKEISEIEGAYIEAAEYLDRATLDLIEKRKNTMTKIKDLPEVEQSICSMIYLELAGEDAGIEALAEILMEVASDSGSDPDTAWAVSGETEIEKMRAFRHAAAETVNLAIEEIRREEPRITKLGTDISLSKRELIDALRCYRTDMIERGLLGCIFGHVMGTHLHVNILARNYEEYQKGKELIGIWSKQAAMAGEQITVEHGLGKIKRHLLCEALSKDRIQAIKTLKEKYDPIHLWNKGNVFLEESL